MHRIFRKSILVTQWAVALSFCMAFTSGHAATAPTLALVARGRYLATAADCVACHTAQNGKPMAGGLAIDSPFGKIYSSNITPSQLHGIGNYSEAQFARAVREGVTDTGKNLYPAMPYTAYAGISDDDMKALYAFFMRGVAPVDTETPATQLVFPFNLRWLMKGWNLLFVHRQPMQPQAGKSTEWNRGRYLVETLGHCSSCHTPRNFAMAEKENAALSGGQIGPWQAPNITSDPISGIGGWTEAELVRYFRTGTVAGRSQAAGGMAEAIQNSLQYLTDADLQAIAHYLKTTTPVRAPSDKQAAWSYGGQSKNYEPALRASNPGIGYGSNTMGYPHLSTGAQLYSANCASCHQVDGRGTKDTLLPSLRHNTTLGRGNADNLVMVILSGLHIRTQNNERLMPAFAEELSDDQIAELTNFVLSEYGNPQVKVDAKHVALLRSGGDPSAMQMIYTVAVVCLLLVLALAFILWKLRRSRRLGTL